MMDNMNNILMVSLESQIPVTSAIWASNLSNAVQLPKTGGHEAQEVEQIRSPILPVTEIQ